MKRFLHRRKLILNVELPAACPHGFQMPPQPLLVVRAHLIDVDVQARRRLAVQQNDVAPTRQFQLVLVQQRAQSQLGVHLVTPLMIDGSDAIILVDRGWVPTVEAAPESIVQFDVPGTVTISGTIQLTERLPSTARADLDSAEFKRDVFQINIPRLQRQMPYELAPVFLLQAPDADQGPLDQPFRQEPRNDLSNGPHLGYALQWFSFAVIAIVFYFGYLRRYG